MNEKELRVVFNITPDPDVNKVDITDNRTRNEIINIINVFKQNETQQTLPFKRIKALEKVLSYN